MSRAWRSAPPFLELLGAGGEQAVGRALEEEERRLRFERGIGGHQLAVAGLELAEVFLLLAGQPLEHLLAARIAREPRRARIELEAAALGRDGDAQRVAREDRLGGHRRRLGRLAGAAVLARAVDLQDALRGAKLRAVGHFFEQRLDIRAQELERLIAGLADEVEVPRMAVRVLEPEAALAEVHAARDAGVDHPLQRAVDRRAADPGVLRADQIDQLLGAEVAFLAQEHVDDEVALARAPAAGGPVLVDELGGGRDRHRRQALNDEPHPQVDLAFGFLMVKPPPMLLSTKSTSAFFRYRRLIGSTNRRTPFTSNT